MVETLQDRMTQTVHASLAGEVSPFASALRLPAMQHFWNLHTTAGLAALNQEVTRQAAMIAYIDNFKFMMVVTLAAIPLLALLRRARPPAGAVHAVAD
jgi:DHA2 family multidrug resistance protein